MAIWAKAGPTVGGRQGAWVPSKRVEAEVTKLMLQRHGTKDFFTNNLDSIMQTVQKTSRSLTLLLSLLSAIFVGFAGWHGGKLVFDHGVGVLVSPKS